MPRHSHHTTTEGNAQANLRCKTAATAKSTITLLLLGWALLEEESAADRT